MDLHIVVKVDIVGYLAHMNSGGYDAPGLSDLVVSV